MSEAIGDFVGDEMGKKLRWSRRLSHVPRWSVVPTTSKQNVAMHSYNVAMLVRVVLGLHDRWNDEGFRLRVIEAALDHDNDEAASGDTPSTYKHGGSIIVAYDQLRVIVKIADVLEAVLFVDEERNMGNTYYMNNDVLLYNESKLFTFVSMFEWREDYTGLKSGRAMLELVRGILHNGGEVNPGIEHMREQAARQD